MSKRAARIVSRDWIISKARGLRKYLEFPSFGFINPLSLLDRVTSKPLDKSGTIFGDYEIVPDSAHFIPDGNAAYTDLDQRKIYVRERTVKQFKNGRFQREAFDIFHEVGHLILHCVSENSTWNVPDDYVYRCDMEDPERQADLFAAELYIPSEDVKGKTVGEILGIYRCSPSVAQRRVEECNN